ncbi:MAG: hypothetical protein GY854_19205 [Deltaproteobacteria bacterium]|nr:hypothetical protein [Deltaproteobacteria bacterium]
MPTSRKLVDIIEKNADLLTKRWLERVRKHPGTPTYREYDEKELYDRAFNVYSQIGKWIAKETTKADIARHYTALGAQRRKEGFKRSEVFLALIITRRVLWFRVQEEGFLDTVLNLHLALELNNQVIQFFDRAIYFAAVGYDNSGIVSPESLTLPPDSVY